MVTKKGQDGPGPLHIAARRELLGKLLQLEAETGLSILSEEELFLIQRLWKSARDPDDGYGVGRIVSEQRGYPMSEPEEQDKLRELEESIAGESGISAATLRRMLAKVADYGESHRAFGLPDELLQILQDDLRSQFQTRSHFLIHVFVSIDSLEVDNFGPYYGKQVFHFTPLDGRSSILIGGKNGAGKTHLAARFVSFDRG